MPKRLYKALARKWLILPALAILCFATSLIFKDNPELTEKWYTQTIYPVVARILSSISTIFPFSVDDIYYLLLIASPFILLGLSIFKIIKFRKAGKLALNLIAANYILFYLLWGFNYFRPDLNHRLSLVSRSENKEEFIRVFEQLIVQTNALHCSFDSLSKADVDRLIEDSYQRLAPALKLKYPMGMRKDKQITFSNFYAKTGITGYFGPFFNEVHVNRQTLPLEYPFVLAHEKAHQFGICSEAEANFYGWMACRYSESQALRYSGNLMVLYHFIAQAYAMEEYPELIKKLDEKVKKDFNDRSAHWRKLRNKKMDKVASKANDIYLKSNHVKKGIEDYNGVVQHLMNFTLDTAFQEKLVWCAENSR